MPHERLGILVVTINVFPYGLLQLSNAGVGASVHAVGTVVTCSVIGTGVILSVAGEALAFVPNALGRALLHNERL